MARKAGTADVAPMVRGAFKRALMLIEQANNGNRGLSELIRDSLESDFLGTMKMIAQFTPKELEATIERKRSADDFTDAELLAIIEEGSGSDTAESESGTGPLH